jgi:hypothetical protein
LILISFSELFLSSEFDDLLSSMATAETDTSMGLFGLVGLFSKA